MKDQIILKAKLNFSLSMQPQKIPKNLLSSSSSDQEEIRKLIVIDYKRGVKLKDIAVTYGYHYDSVTRIIREYNRRKTIKRKPGSGRTYDLKNHQKANIINAIRRNPFLTCGDLQIKYAPCISVERIRQYLKEKNFTWKKPRKIPKLSPNDKDDRFFWSIKYYYLPFWKVVWTDECAFWIQDRKGSCWIRKGEEYELETMLHPLKVNVWIAIAIRGVVAIHVFEQQFNSSHYLEILQKRLLPGVYNYSKLWHPGFKEDWLLQQDNLSVHVCEKIDKFLNYAEIKKLEWPVRSPDLNPVENLWAKLKSSVRKRDPQTKKQLKLYIYEEVNKISQSYFLDLVSSVGDRIIDVFNSRGAIVRA